MAVLLNIPQGMTNKQLKLMKENVNKIVPQDAISTKTLSFMFDESTKSYIYRDDLITETSVVTVALGDEYMARDYGIDYTINVTYGNIIFTCESVPYDDCGMVCEVNAIVKIANI